MTETRAGACVRACDTIGTPSSGPSGTFVRLRVLLVEILAQSFDGRYLQPGAPWVRPCGRPGWYWLDADALASHAETLTGKDRQVLTLAAALASGDPCIHRQPAETRWAAA